MKTVFYSHITTTENLDSFQYIDEELQFFPIPIAIGKGYVRKTDGSNRKWFDYVYNYTDHLGNIRLSYTSDPLSSSTNNIKILEENNYYPFGLKHGSYNTPARDYRPIDDAREIETVDRNPYKYKYQGQERQDELNLNWDSFKWRNYDYALGRFMSVDPLAEEYSYQSPYNFAENRVVDGNELEGLEWSSHTDEEGVIHQILRVNPINNSENITDNQMHQAMDLAEIQFAQDFSGLDSDGNNVIATIITDPEATISIEFNDTFVNVPEAADAIGLGYTEEIGGTQENKIQVHVGRNMTDGKFDIEKAAQTIIHEKGHTGGLKHVRSSGGTELEKTVRQKEHYNEKNLMQGEAKGTELIPEQRKIIDREVRKQQTK